MCRFRLIATHLDGLLLARRNAYRHQMHIRKAGWSSAVSKRAYTMRESIDGVSKRAYPMIESVAGVGKRV